MKTATTILFDWDGTLLDSFPSTYRASIAVLNHYGIEVDYERYLETYSPNWYASYAELGVPEEEWANADRLWRQTYHKLESELFPFTPAMLEKLHRAGRTLGVVTSGNRDRVVQELERHGLTAFFDATICFEDTHEKKPHPAPLRAALETLRVSPETTVYVGDRPEDIEMGQRVGTFTVGVESKYGPRALLEEAEPDVILDHAGHLPDHLEIE